MGAGVHQVISALTPVVPVQALDEFVDSGQTAVDAAPDTLGAALAVLVGYYLVGAVLLSVWPGFSATVTETIVRRPIRAVLAGAVVLVGVAALAVASFAVLWITGPFLVFALVWLPIALVALVYVSVAITGSVLSLVGVENQYGALVISGIAPMALAWAPRDAIVDLLFVGVLTLGGGAMAWSAWEHGRRATR